MLIINCKLNVFKEKTRSLIANILPFLEDRKYRINIEKKIEELSNTEISNIELNKLEYASDLTKVPLEIIKSSYEASLKRKTTIEDKAKVNVIGVTIFISLISALSSFILKIYSYTNNQLLKFGIFIFSSITIFYMLYGGIMSLEVLMNKNKIFILSEEESNSNEPYQKKACARNIELNGYSNTIRSNYIYSSYHCIKYALILLMVIFLVYIFPYLNNSSDKFEESLKSLNSDTIELRKDLELTNSKLNDYIIQIKNDEKKIEDLEKENIILHQKVKR